MNIVYDLILISVIVVFGVIGFKRGCIAMLIGVFKWLIALVVAMGLSSMIAGAFFDAFLAPSMEKKIAKYVDNSTLEVVVQLNEVEEKLGIDVLDNSVESEILARVAGGEKLEAVVCDTVVRPMQMEILHPVCFMLIFGIVVFLCGIAQKLFSKANAIPILGRVNAFLGILPGLAEGLVIACLAACVLSLLVSFVNLPFLNKNIMEKTVLIDTLASVLLWR